MKQWVDLTEPLVEGHWRYNEFVQTCDDGPEGFGRYMNVGHAFTHIDAPRHMIHGGRQLDEFPLFDFLIGPAAVLDCGDVRPNQPIDRALLESAFEGCNTTDVLLVKTSWGKTCSSSLKDHWMQAPYMTQSGVDFLRSLKPKAVGFDFPQDFGIRCSDADSNLVTKEKDYDADADNKLRPGPPTPENSPTHFSLLPYDILMIEYMTNLWKVPVKNVEICALPLKLKMPNTDGAPIRVAVRF